MRYERKTFNTFTVKEVENFINYDLEKFIQVFTDGYTAIYRANHEILELYRLIEQQNSEIKQALNQSNKRLGLLEKEIKNFKE